MLVLEVTLYSDARCSENFREILTFCKLPVFIIKLGSGNFSDRSWMFVCSMQSISCKTLEGPQLDLGPVEAVEGVKQCQRVKMAMLAKLGLVKLVKSGITNLGDH